MPFTLLKGERAFLLEIFSRRRYRALQLGVDLPALVAAWFLAVEIRVLLNPVLPLQLGHAQLLELAPPLWGVLALWVVASAWLKVYEPGTGPFAGAYGMRALESGLVAGTAAVVATFFSRGLGAALSRSIVLLFVPASCLLLGIARFFVCRLVLYIETRWPGVERVAMLGSGRDVQGVVDVLRYAWRSAFDLVGVIVPVNSSFEMQAAGHAIPVLGTTRQLAELINRERLQRILVVDGALARREMEECSRISKRMGVTLNRTIAVTHRHARMELAARSGLHMLEMKPVQFLRHQELTKRAFDIVTAGLALVLLAPLLAVIAVLIKLTSKGPVLYRSRRVGRGGRHFDFLKFRSMYQGVPKDAIAHMNEREGHLFKIRNDPRVTTVGRILRRYSLDELPQLINVLRGDMSLVGPRPLPASDLDADGHSRRFRTWADQRAKVLPGITGLWQVRGRSDLPFDKMTELDVYYIRNWSLALDFQILLETPLVVLTGRGAY